MSFTTIGEACDSNIFNVFYLPLDASFYVPPTREFIVKNGSKIEIASCELTNILDVISQGNGDIVQADDLSGLRILVIDKSSGNEFFITVDKVILSKDRRFTFDVKIINNVLKEIIGFSK